jgi:hypothetical protein
MATIRVTGYTRDGVERAARDLAAALAGRGSPGFDALARDVQNAVGAEALTLVCERFDALKGGGSYGGERWAPLAPVTVKRKGHATIGEDTEALRSALEPGAGGPSGVPGQVFDVKPDGVAVGCDLDYAARFHRGTARQPARPLWPDPLPDGWRTRVAAAGRKAFVAALARALGAAPP